MHDGYETKVVLVDCVSVMGLASKI
jgi:hypothetical protein